MVIGHPRRGCIAAGAVLLLLAPAAADAQDAATVGDILPRGISRAAESADTTARARLAAAKTGQESSVVLLKIPSPESPEPPPRIAPQPPREKIRSLGEWIGNAYRRFRLRVARSSAILLQNLISYTKIEIQGSYRVTNAELLQAAGLDRSRWAWGRAPKKIEEALERLAWIESAQVQLRHLPLRLQITVKEAEPWIVAEYEGGSWLVSTNGKLLQTLDTVKDTDLILEIGDLPRLDGLEPHTGVESYLTSPNARFMHALKLIKFLEMAGELPFAFDRLTLLRSGGLRIYPIERSRFPEVVLAATSLEETQEALRKLRLVLNDLRFRKEAARQVDLRFPNQAVVR